MAKKSQGSDKITPTVKKHHGVQSIGKEGSDYGARGYWDEAANPASVKKMVGRDGEFARYKHDDE
jgi:hypothetical protein